MSLYVADEFARVRPSDVPGTKRAALLSAARNEYAPFQIVVRAGASGLKRVNATAGPLVPKWGRIIPADRITLYREHYIAVKKLSPKSKGPTGWYPDALIPFTDPSTGKPPLAARFPAAPFDIAPDSNQPLWVDVLTPVDATPGEYTGSITISATGVRPQRVPIKLTVWGFTLPETPSMRTHFGDAEVNPLFRPQSTASAGLGEARQRALQTAYAKLMAAHRICSPIPPFLMPSVNADGSIDPGPTDTALQEWINRFHVTAFPILFLGTDGAGWQGDLLGADRERNSRYLRSMYSYLRAHHWDKMAYIYVADEPNSREACNNVRARSRLVREVVPGLKVLCTTGPQVRPPPWGTLAGWVDIWVPLWPMFEEAAVRKRLSAGEEVWSYTALCQGRQDTPFWELDFPLLNYRIPMWINWRFGATGLFYWSTMNWASTRDVWTNPVTYADKYNMEGSLLYPGADAGVEGFITSIRLKQIREGLEDYEYLTILEQHQGRMAADDVVKKIARSWQDWDTDARHLVEARAKIAGLILAK
ncbi:MAG TPA: glycoside hydrolase domain-containing protein [Bryobacteraceae bacterium]|nr:glycoside hydrolase domain-containing protein [Bryobacteraceae bacterium]